MKTRSGKRGRRACGLALAAALLAPAAGAGIMTEMTFGTPATNGTGASVAFDLSPSLATGLLHLRGDGTYVTEILAAPTGIGRRWDKRLQHGFLHVGAFTQVNEPRNRIGTSTDDRMSRYLGSPSGSDIPGTLHMVFRPAPEWTTSHRRTLTGTGSTGWVYMRLWVPQNSNTLTFDYVRKYAPAAKCQVTVQKTWDTNTWYFVAISWAYNQEPLLYLREMSPLGPEASPAATLGTLTVAEGFQSTVPAGVNDMPFVRPLTIGAYYYDPGGNAGTVDGAAAHIAYFRLDNNLSTCEEIEEVFNGLFAPPKRTLMVLR